ncbi:50S ribosomal protein L25/general stress protein Ctc [Amnibacterium sp.]|uniref:50S ribosomal protein L25/general stress protein Ctc n=1 Tax=Amnibacterium sp. TaxID=1872496 RepID=UPI003F7B6D1B
MADKIAAEARTSFGKGAARKLRAAGRIPAVVYGHGTDPVHISLPGHETALIIRRANAVLELALPSGSQLALVKDVQKDPVRQIIEHIDLLVVRAGEKVEVEVPVVLHGESFPGTVATLDAQHLLLKVSATAIPEHVVVDIEGAQDGTRITAADVTLPEGVELGSDPELLVVGVSLAPAEEALENESAAEASEPEAAEPVASAS